MATTMKKAEILSTAKAGILEKLNLEARGARQIGASTFALPIEVDGIVCWVKVAFTCANPIATDKVPAFDIEQACGDWEFEREEKERVAAEKAAEKERKAQERAAKKKA